MFNMSNANQIFECPNFVIALLRDIDYKIGIVYWNKYQKEWDSAFGNTGNEYHNGVFDVYAYQWDEDNVRMYNFKCDDIEISWYKYLGRDTTININPNSRDFNDKVIKMYNKCMDSLLKAQEEDLD